MQKGPAIAGGALVRLPSGRTASELALGAVGGAQHLEFVGGLHRRNLLRGQPRDEPAIVAQPLLARRWCAARRPDGAWTGGPRRVRTGAHRSRARRETRTAAATPWPGCNHNPRSHAQWDGRRANSRAMQLRCARPSRRSEAVRARTLSRTPPAQPDRMRVASSERSTDGPVDRQRSALAAGYAERLEIRALAAD